MIDGIQLSCLRDERQRKSPAGVLPGESAKEDTAPRSRKALRSFPNLRYGSAALRTFRRSTLTSALAACSEIAAEMPKRSDSVPSLAFSLAYALASTGSIVRGYTASRSSITREIRISDCGFWISDSGACSMNWMELASRASVLDCGRPLPLFPRHRTKRQRAGAVQNLAALPRAVRFFPHPIRVIRNPW